MDYKEIITFIMEMIGTVAFAASGAMVGTKRKMDIFVRHIYACASIVGALTCVWIYRIFGEVEAMMVSSAVVLFIRYLAAHYRLDLPRLELKEFRDHENRL